MLIPHAETLWLHSKGKPGADDKSRDKGIPRNEWNTDLLDALALYYMGQERNDEGVPCNG